MALAGETTAANLKPYHTSAFESVFRSFAELAPRRHLDADLEAVLVSQILVKTWDVVVIGGGIRKPPELLILFEKVTNAVHWHAPQAAIALNTKPTDCLEAAKRMGGLSLAVTGFKPTTPV